jgi:nitrate reductase NapAB chaperone NapD
MLMVVAVGKEHEIIRKVQKIPGVVEASVVYGEFDVVAKIEGTLRQLDNANLKVRKLSDVLRTVTLIAH